MNLAQVDESIHLRFEQNTSRDEGTSVLKIGRKVNRREWRENLSEINSVKRREPVEQYWGIDINGLKNDFLGSAGVQFFMCSAVKTKERYAYCHANYCSTAKRDLWLVSYRMCACLQTKLQTGSIRELQIPRLPIGSLIAIYEFEWCMILILSVGGNKIKTSEIGNIIHSRHL